VSGAFLQDAVEIQYSSETLYYKVSTYDPQVQETMKILCQNLLNRLHGRQDFVEEVRRTIQLIQPYQFPNIEQVAEHLGCAPRTLRRRLQQEQENFQKILDEERKAVACDYLRNSNLSIGEIAERCGFQSPQPPVTYANTLRLINSFITSLVPP
jgi:AraC-like DNA-binding protein